MVSKFIQSSLIGQASFWEAVHKAPQICKQASFWEAVYKAPQICRQSTAHSLISDTSGPNKHPTRGAGINYAGPSHTCTMLSCQVHKGTDIQQNSEISTKQCCGSGSGNDPNSMGFVQWNRIRIHLKCWIRIRLQWIRIHTPNKFSFIHVTASLKIFKYQYDNAFSNLFTSSSRFKHTNCAK